MNTMKIRLLIIILIASFGSSFAQYKLDYDKDSKWFWDFNLGATWHTSDVRTKLNNGFGFTVGKSFNFNYGKKVSFDLRARFLAGDWQGQNKDFTRFDSTYSDDGVYASIYHDYKNLGYTIENFETSVRRLSAELVIHLNSLRETTGWDPYIFGGIGYTWSRTRGDLVDSLGAIYNYNDSENYGVLKLSQLLDGEYESNLDNGSGTFIPRVMPSIGFGIGYQVAKRVSLGIEHKTTFTQDDIFDGVVKDGKYLQDLYHYTSAYIRFQIRSRRYDEYKETTPENVVVEEEVFTQPPIVNLTRPRNTTSTTTNQNYTISSSILYVRGKQNIQFQQNQKGINTFSYSLSSKMFSRSVVLKEGENNFMIKGTNEYGADSVVFSIIYEKPEGVPPTVQITNPRIEFTTVNSSRYNLKSTVRNISSKSQISFTVNGRSISQFSYNSSTQQVTSNLNLSVGNNLITISATNEYGADSKTTAINYVIPVKPPTTKPPVRVPTGTPPPTGGSTPPVRTPR